MCKVICPLCESENILHIELVKKEQLTFLYKKLTQEDFGYLINKDINYCECLNCNLKFYSPLITGDEKFYNSLQKFDWYYMDEKDEYHYAKKFIKSEDKVLEIGSGKGAFRKFIVSDDYIGLDFSENAKILAEKNGIIIENKSIEEYAEKCKDTFDIVVNFQVLEHVLHPKSFIESSLNVLKKDGLMIIAVPSENSFLKYVTNGILNMPPHHVTRWTDDTFRYLEQKYDLKIIDIFHEKLQPIHKEWFLQTFLMVKILKNRLIDLSFVRKIISTFSRLLAKYLLKGLNNEMLPNGHTVVVVFQKK